MTRPGSPATIPLPTGFRIVLHDDTRELADGLWHGGSPARVLRLSADGQRALDDLRRGPVHDRATGLIARRFVDAGLAHPTPGSRPHLVTPDVTIVIPVLDRAAELERCLTSLGVTYPVIVVDDGSADELAIRAVAHRHDTRVVRLDRNVGPAAARAAGLAHVDTEFVAFIDSDTEPGCTWIAELAPQFIDSVVAAVAPRVVAAGLLANCSTASGALTSGALTSGALTSGALTSGAPTSAAAYGRARSCLDLGPRPAEVRPYGRVAHVPSAALLARTEAIRAVGGFDTALRVGEDVDLVWRLTATRRRVRYVPAVRIAHHEPSTWRDLFSRRFRYGRSAAPLALRHPGQLAPAIVHPWYTGTVAALIAGRPRMAMIGLVGTALVTHRALAAAGLPATEVPRQVAGGLGRTWQSTGRYARQFALPILLASTLCGTTRTRLAAAALVAGPVVADWRGRRTPLDPLRFTVAAVIDDAAYGAGVIAGCIAERTTAPLRPIRARSRATRST